MEPEDDYPDGDDDDGMRPMAKAGRINLIILLIYAGLFLVSSLVGARGDAMSAWLVYVGVALLVQTAVNLVLCIVFFIMRKSDWGKATLVSGLVLLVIGFSTCVAAISTLSFH